MEEALLKDDWEGFWIDGGSALFELVFKACGVTGWLAVFDDKLESFGFFCALGGKDG